MLLLKINFKLTSQFRKRPILGPFYRPLLFFSNDIVRSGELILEEDELLDMEGHYFNKIIKLWAYKPDEIDKEFYSGRTFTMAEGGRAIVGEGIIIECLGEE